MSDTIRVAILDDHQSIIDGYCYRLSNCPDITIVGAIRYGDELMPLLEAHSVDVLVLDVIVPTSEHNSSPYPILHAISRVLDTYPQINVIVISAHCQRALIRAVMEAGASGYVLKEDGATISDLGNLIRSVAHGSIHFSAPAFQAMTKDMADNPVPVLTERESEVLALCAAYPEETAAQMAKRLRVAHSTVRNLLSDVYVQLGVRTRTAAVDKGRRLGLIAPYSPDTYSAEVSNPKSRRAGRT